MTSSACSLSTNNTDTHFSTAVDLRRPSPGRFTQPGRDVSINFATAGVGTPTAFGGGDLYNFAPLNYLQRPDERYTAGEFSHYQINPHLDVYSSFMFMHDSSFAQIAGSGAFYRRSVHHQLRQPAADDFGSVRLLRSDAGTSTLQPLDIGRRDVEGVGRVSDIEHFDYRFVIGARGEITDGWNYDVSAQYGHSDLQEQELGYFSISKTNNALDVISNGAGGVECADAAARAAGCVPWNIFNNPAFPGGVTAAQLKYLETTAASRRRHQRTGGQRQHHRRPRQIRHQVAVGQGRRGRQLRRRVSS